MIKRIFLFITCTSCFSLSHAQEFGGVYTTEWQWDMNKNTNWLNLLRLEMNLPLNNGKGAFEAATLHVAKSNEGILGDWQGFSNIEADNNVAAIAVLGYMHEWKHGHLFVGVRNVNEDFFTSDATALFLNSSCGIFPTIAANYPIANYPYSGLTLYFDITKGGWTFKNSLYNGVGYNGWNRHDNPFLVRPKKDGIFNMSQLEYAYSGGQYFAGAAIHTRQFPVDEQGELSSADDAKSKTTCAWWIYGEQQLWTIADKSLTAMLQYSEIASHESCCYRYAAAGCTYKDSHNECGLSGLYARYQQGKEYTLELTFKRQLSESISIQPSFQYISNDDGDFTAAALRLCYSF